MRTSDFLLDVKRHISVPTYQPRFTDEDVLAIASSVQKSNVVAEITSLREEFFIVEEDLTITAGTGKVAIPERAIGRVIRDIFVQVPGSTDYKRIPKLELEDIRGYSQSSVSEQPFGWFIQNDNIHIHPIYTSDDVEITVKYAQRPSDLVKESRTATIVSFTDDTVTVDEVPDNIEVGSKCDITQVDPGFGIVIRDAVVSNVSATTITFTGYSALNPLSGFAAGDIVSSKRETSVVQLPEDWHDVLLWGTCVGIVTALGIPDQIEQAQREYNGVLQQARNLCSPRVENTRPKNFDPNGILRRRNYARRFPLVTV